MNEPTSNHRRTKYPQSYNYFALGQIILGVSLLCCLVIIPHFFFSFDQGGVSNYGTEPQTKWLFVTGFSAVALGTLLAAITLPRGSARRLQLRAILLTLTVLYLFVMASTFSYKLSPALGRLHERSALVLFGGMLLASLWLRFVALKDTYTSRAFILLCIFLVLGALNFVGIVHVLFIVEIACGAIFAMLMTHVMQALTPRA